MERFRVVGERLEAFEARPVVDGVATYRAHLLPRGVFHPNDGMPVELSGGEMLVFEEAELQAIRGWFEREKVEVHVTWGHPWWTGDPRDSAGIVTAMSVEPGGLYAEVSIDDPEAVRAIAAKRASRVSIVLGGDKDPVDGEFRGPKILEVGLVRGPFFDNLEPLREKAAAEGEELSVLAAAGACGGGRVMVFRGASTDVPSPPFPLSRGGRGGKGSEDLAAARLSGGGLPPQTPLPEGKGAMSGKESEMENLKFRGREITGDEASRLLEEFAGREQGLLDSLKKFSGVSGVQVHGPDDVPKVIESLAAKASEVEKLTATVSDLEKYRADAEKQARAAAERIVDAAFGAQRFDPAWFNKTEDGKKVNRDALIDEVLSSGLEEFAAKHAVKVTDVFSEFGVNAEGTPSAGKVDVPGEVTRLSKIIAAFRGKKTVKEVE